MSAQENLKVAREASEAFARGDMQRIDELTADDVIWHEIGRAEPRVGKAALRAAGAEMADYTMTGTTHDILASDDHAVTLVEVTATRGDKTLAYRTAEIHHIRDGKIAERWAFSDDTAAITEFFH